MKFDFLNYCNSTEDMMQAWYRHNHETLSQSYNLGYAREHFVKEILNNFLPKSVVVGSGEIVDSIGGRSGQQDIIIYRSDFPVITSLTPVNTYLIEGVVATIEVKSNLSTGDPIGITTAFKNIARVKPLIYQAESPIGSSEDEQKALRKIHTAKAYVVGYAGWDSKEKFIENYVKAANLTKGIMPDVVYQPSGCIINPNILPNVYRKNEQTGAKEVVPLKENSRLFCSSHPFALFFQSILRSVMEHTGSLVASYPPMNSAIMWYSLENYFRLPEIKCNEAIKFVPHEGLVS